MAFCRKLLCESHHTKERDLGEHAFKDRQGIHGKDGLGTIWKGHEEAREMWGLKIMEDSRLAPEKKIVNCHQDSVSNGREMLLC